MPNNTHAKRLPLGFVQVGFSSLGRLLGLAPLQAPQSARLEDEGENRGHAEREECPDGEGSAGLCNGKTLVVVMLLSQWLRACIYLIWVMA
jgi:hypothetical protein